MDYEAGFHCIRRSCQAVAESARHVHIIPEQVDTIVDRLGDSPLQVPEIDTAAHYVADEPSTIAFFTTLAAVNFGSGYFPRLSKRSGLSGYYTIATALTEHFESSGLLSAQELTEMTASDCAHLFGQRMEDPAIAELMSLFATSWNDLGSDLLDRFGGSFATLITAADHRAAKLVALLAEQPKFNDVSHYHGHSVSFFKRSQLLASDLSIALSNAGLGQFDDLDQLTIFADNLVPHVLRIDGVLAYEPDLLGHIEAERLIPAGSDEEIEIRACTIHAVELMIAAAAKQGISWTARDVDQVLWHRGQDPDVKRQGKRHRTRTVFY